MTKSQIILTTTIVVVAIAAAIAVKMIFFPSINDKYFTATGNRFKDIPSGYLVIRRTHFPHGYGSQPSRIMRSFANGNERIAGFNITLQRLIALAYNENPSRISLPWNAPTNKNYDILVTTRGIPSQQLQSLIRRKLGFVADRETNDVPVQALKIENPNPQTFKVSPDTEKPNEDMKNGKLLFTHMRLETITSGLEQITTSPIVDETGLTNYYDFSLNLTSQLQKLMRSGARPDIDTVTQILDQWGLGFEPDTAPMEMLVVKKAY